MSQENVEIVRRVLDGFSRSDRESVERLLQPDVQWRTVLGPLLGVETVSGRDAMLRFAFEEIPDAIENPHVEVEELTDLGEGRVLLVARYVGRGKRSGIELDQRISSVHHLSDGMIASVSDYPSRAEALEAAGLRDQAMSQENVEVVRRMYKAFHSGDIDGALSHFDPDVLVDASEARPDDVAIGTGHERLIQIVTSWVTAWDEWREEIAEMRDLDSRVLVLSVQRGRGKGSGVAVEARWAVLYELDRGVITSMRIYPQSEEALEAAGLQE